MMYDRNNARATGLLVSQQVAFVPCLSFCCPASSAPKHPAEHPRVHPSFPVQVQALIQKLQNGEIEALPGRTLTETFEAAVNEALNKARDAAGKMAQSSVTWNNNIMRMVNAGK